MHATGGTATTVTEAVLFDVLGSLVLEEAPTDTLFMTVPVATAIVALMWSVSLVFGAMVPIFHTPVDDV